MSDYSPLKCAVIWAGVLLVVVALMVPIAVMANHYNDTEVARANACTAEHGAYVEGHCVWTSR